mgnify:CR=1 FL=1
MSAHGRHYEYAENGRKPHDVLAGQTHGSAPTAKCQCNAQADSAALLLSMALELPPNRAIKRHDMSGNFQTASLPAVGADPCVRPAVTLILLPPLFGKFVMPTTGGHIGPPLRRMARMGENYPTHSVIQIPYITQNIVHFTTISKNPSTHHVNITS